MVDLHAAELVNTAFRCIHLDAEHLGFFIAKLEGETSVRCVPFVLCGGVDLTRTKAFGGDLLEDVCSVQALVRGCVPGTSYQIRVN